MTFGEKLKALRADNGLTQEELADKIFVTRTAISKWETDKGYPSIDSLKQLSNLFHISIDELISDDDIENKKSLDEKNARKMYFVAIAFLVVTVLFTLLAYFLKLPYLNIFSASGAILYLVYTFLSKPKYKREQSRKVMILNIIIRVAMGLFVIGAVMYTIGVTL